MNESATPLCTNILLGAIHFYPQTSFLLATTRLAAKSISASLVMMNGSAPPNSNTHFLRCLPEIYAMTLPDILLPVKETP